mmetsp:Transcript_2906/g.6790  ORF Transcript_2906/g.6790 Transcript_2906/m.6790 type:complete len:83 (+) Transcript_2906:1593-1841(+)
MLLAYGPKSFAQGAFGRTFVPQTSAFPPLHRHPEDGFPRKTHIGLNERIYSGMRGPEEEEEDQGTRHPKSGGVASNRYLFRG